VPYNHLLVVVVFFFCASPSAYSEQEDRCGELELSPNPASTSQQVVAEIVCACQVPVESPTIQIDGPVITITYRASRLCGVPPTPPTYEFNLGRLPPGLYTVVHAPVRFPSGGELPSQSSSLRVISASVPTLASPRSQALLALLLLLLGLTFYTRRGN